MIVKLNKRTYVPLALMVIVMIAIFGFSAQNGSESNGMSSVFSRLFCRIIFSDFNKMTAEQQVFVVSGVNYFIRKAAHFTAYAALGACSYLFFYFSEIRLRGKIFPLAVITSAIYAVIDEVHQYFTPGRSIKITDMLLDTAGATFGAVFIMAVIIIVLHIKSQAKINIKEKSDL